MYACVRMWVYVCIFGCLYVKRKKGNVLFHDVLNTFYLQLYGVRHMVKDHSDSKRGNPLTPHGLLFDISMQGFFYMHHPTDRIIHTMVFVTPEREIAQCVHYEGSIQRPIALERTILPWSYISLVR